MPSKQGIKPSWINCPCRHWIIHMGMVLPVSLGHVMLAQSWFPGENRPKYVNGLWQNKIQKTDICWGCVCLLLYLVLVVVFSILFQVQKLLGVFLSFIFLWFLFAHLQHFLQLHFFLYRLLSILNICTSFPDFFFLVFLALNWWVLCYI